MMRIGLGIIGALLLLIGIGGAVSALGQKTTVQAEDASTKQVHNIGLIGDKQCGVVVSSMLAVVGAVFVGASVVSLTAEGERVAALLEAQKDDREAMVRALARLVILQEQKAQRPSTPPAARPAPRSAPAGKPAGPGGDPLMDAVVKDLLR